MLNTIYRNQVAIFQSGDLRGGLLRIAQSSGMTEKQFMDCVSDENAHYDKTSSTTEGAAREGFVVSVVPGR